MRLAALRSACTPLAVGTTFFTVLYVGWLLSRTGGAYRTRVASVATLPVVYAAAWAAWSAGRTATPARGAWRWIGVGTLGLALGMTCWALRTFHVPLWKFTGDVGTAAYYCCLVAGLRALARAQWERHTPSRFEQARFWLDMMIVVLAGGAVVWMALIAPVTADAAPVTTFAQQLDRVLNIVYPIASLGVLFGAASLLLREAPSTRAFADRFSIELVAAGGFFAFTADLGSSYLSMQPGQYQSGSWPDVSWAIGTLLWVFGAEHARRAAMVAAREDAPDAVPTRGARAPRVSWLPYAAIAVGYAVLLRDVRGGHWTAATGGLLVIAGALTAVVVARQVLAVRESAGLFQLLSTREARFRAIFDQSPTSILLVGDDGIVLESNSALQQLLGFSADELRGTLAVAVVHPDEVPRVSEAARELTSRTRSTAAIETRFRHRSGATVWASLTIAHGDADGRPCLIGIAEDITERKRLETELVHQAFHDALTGLANRALFRDRVTHALARAARDGGTSVAALFLDLDDFKAVNDSLGHAAGDQLLVAVAERVQHATRGGDTVARLGGDEFAVLVEDVTSDAAAVAAAERIVASLAAPATVLGRAIRVNGSVGVARARAGDGADALLRNADMAMYQAKQSGKGRVALYAPAMHAAALDRLELQAALRAALDRQVEPTAARGGQDGEMPELYTVYQPLVDLASGVVTGFEALLRWTHPTRGGISPAVFIPIAEETGLIVALGRWMLRTACATAAAWDAADADVCMDAIVGAVPGVSVNLSGRQLAEATLIEDVRGALADSGLSPSRLTLEITESVIMHDVEQTLATLTALKALGVRLAIDDFGTGYSSLSQLQRFPVDVLKIDKSFVDGVAHGPTEAALARTVVALGSTLHLRTVAEGIEHPEQHAVLQRLGCDVGQGFLFARPMAADAVATLLRPPRAAAAIAG